MGILNFTFEDLMLIIPSKVFVHCNSKVFKFFDPFDWSSIYVYL